MSDQRTAGFTNTPSATPTPEARQALPSLNTPSSSSQSAQSSQTHKVHHVEEFGEVERLVHIEHIQSADQLDDEPAPRISRKDKVAVRNHMHRLRRRLFAERHLMQYFHNDTLYRTEGNRKVGPDELFLDLVIVGGVAALGHELRENFSGWLDVEKFFLLFHALYSSWRAVIFLWNLFDLRSDLTDKFGIYLTFFSLTGIALGAHGAFDDGIRPYVAGCAFAATAVPSTSMLWWAVKEPLLKNPANIVNQVILASTVSLVSVIPYFAAAFVSTSRATRILFWVPYFIQTISIFITGSFYRWVHRKRPGHTRLAIAIELFVEKYETLTMIVLGESVLGLLFEAALLITEEGAHIGALYAGAAGATAMLYALQTLYVNVDGQVGKGGTHAIRYKGLFGIIWGQLHTWYHMALILFATGLGFAMRDIAIPPKDAASSRMIVDRLVRATGKATGEGPGFGTKKRWVFSAGWGAAIIFSAVLGALHRGGPRAATKVYRLIIRCIVATVIMVGMPFAHISAGNFLVVYMVVLVVIAIVEYICVQMDRMGFIRSEATVLSESSSAVIDSRDSFSEGEEAAEDDEEEGAKEAADLVRDLSEDAAAQIFLDKALKKRLCKRHCNRLIPVEQTIPVKDEDGEEKKETVLL